jgi:predicted lipoprotein with Yx(FWY)xxD motif
MNTRFVSALALFLAATFAISAHADPAAKMVNGKLVNASGMTLYTFDRDVAGSGKSVCNGPCSSVWPPAMAAAGAKAEGDFSIVTRDDGTKQWAYKGKPLYQYGADQKAGDAGGDNVGNVWHVVK